MPQPQSDLVIQVLRDPDCVRSWSEPRFDLMFRQAQSSNLVARLAKLFEEGGLTNRLPAGLARHLDGALRLLKSHRAQIRREVEQIRQALAPLELNAVLLKGAAYVMADLPAEKGRMFSDVDILVPRERLAEVESCLTVAGWATTHQTAYDQRYYRQWMHELPPMVHLVRQTALDVHHAIVPLTARWSSPAAPLIANAMDLSGHAGLQVLAPVDMVLHSMVHLLLNEELSQGLRDVSDLDLLLRHFGREAEFWDGLVERASLLGLQRALHHGLWCAAHVLQTPVPAHTQQAIASWGPGPLPATILKAAWGRALRSPHASAADGGTPFALFALYVRAHWLRMPPLMLARHLWIKAWRLHEPRKDKTKTARVP